jgi:uncharacterized protein YdaT
MVALETVATQVCYTQAEYYDFLNGIGQGMIRLAVVCVVIGYISGRFMPIAINKIKEWYRGRTAQ